MCIFKHPAYFDHAVFQDDVNFTLGRFESHAGFEDAVFKKSAVFVNVTFRRSAMFIGTVFHERASFAYATFDGLTGFDDTEFHDDALFGSSKFGSSVTFGGTTFFARQADFSGVDLRDGNSFSVSRPVRKTSSCDPRPFRLPEQGAELYRLAKESARRQGDHSRAGEYHYAEQCAKEYGNRKESGWKLWRLAFWKSRLEWLFARMIFGYGEKVLRPLFAGLAVILIWAVLYSAMGGIAPGGLEGEAARVHEPGFGECFYFSLVTFTTLGYGDMAPKAHLGFRLVAGGEALLGAGLMALFVVALARKYTR